MKIIKSNIVNLEQDKKTLYLLTKGRSTLVSKMTDEELDLDYPVDAYLFYEDENRRGETVRLLSIFSNGKVLSAQSKPFQESFEEIVDIMGDDPFSIHIEHLMSRNNRKFVMCTLVV